MITPRLQFWLFLLAIAVPGVLLCAKISHLLPLYTHADVRNSVKSALMTVSDREGWLLSNVSVENVTDTDVTLTYRDHHRGEDPKTCHILTMADASLHPCK